MDFPKIAKKETIVFPLVDTFDAVVDAECIYDNLIHSKVESDRPKGKYIYIFRECMKPWFLELYKREGTDKEFLVKSYGKFLRKSIINHFKDKFISREYLNDSGSFFSKIKLCLRVISLSLSQVESDVIVVRFGRLMGSEFEKKVKFALSKESKFDCFGNYVK